MDTSVIGRIIAQKRKEKHMTQEVLAQKLNVTAKTISHWENGYTLPDISLLIPLSNILEITVYELLSGELENRETMNDTINQEQIPLQESEKHEKELEMTVQYAENNMKDLKHRIFNISCYIVTIMLVLLFLEVLREKHTLPDTGWLAISAFLISMSFIPVIIVQTVVLFIQKTRGRFSCLQIKIQQTNTKLQLRNQLEFPFSQPTHHNSLQQPLFFHY